DAHSQAPTPISAVLSGVLLNCALYGIIRFYSLTNSALLGEFSQQLLLVFGLVSIGIAVPFIVLQKDIKRLLAYSSVEHMGIIALGVGLGSKLALMGAMFHLFNHAMAKSMFFMAVGNIAQKFNTKNITRIKGIVHVMPATVVFFLIGAFALTGLPPFSIFMSEFTIAWAGFTAGKYMVSSLYLLFIALIFAGLGYHVTNMSFGRLSRRVAKEKENTWLLAAMCIPLLFVIGLGFSTPAFVTDILEQIAVVVGGE
ncbi:MAG: proton-conducting transporter membrane subunit, partial [Bacillota bacterium]